MLAVMYARLPVPTAMPSYDVPAAGGTRHSEGLTSGAPLQTCHCGGAPVGVVPGGPVMPMVGGPSSAGLGTHRAAEPARLAPESAPGAGVPAAPCAGIAPAAHDA